MQIAEPPAPSREIPVGRTESPAAGKPYLEVVDRAVGPGESIHLAGRNFQAGSTVEIAVDGNVVGREPVGAEGKFAVTVTSPREFGPHTISVVYQGTANAIDGALVLVRPRDPKETNKGSREREDEKRRRGRH